MFRTIASLSLALFITFGGQTSPLAQTASQINLIVPYPAGGGSDFLARTVAPELEKSLGKRIIVENIGGAGGALGSRKVLQHDPDGTTLLLGSPNEVILAPAVNQAITYKAEEFRLISPISLTSLILVARPDLPIADIQALLDHARQKNVDPVSFGSVGIGSLYHVVGEVLAEQTNANLIHVPYRGVAPLVQDLIGGQVDIAFLPLAGSVLSLVQEGKLKAFGVAQDERNPLAPDVPALSEIAPELKNFSYPTWAGILVAASTPDSIVASLQTALTDALSSEKVKTGIQASGSGVSEGMNLDQARDFYRKETLLFQEIVAKNKIQVN